MRKEVAVSISGFLFFQQTMIAQTLVVDNRAEKKHQANLAKSKNGIDIVNVVRPNIRGISHNKFTKYNVNEKGLILNNATDEAKTHLAGYIKRNENLNYVGARGARIILNEVTSKNKTHLKGFTEVAGRRAKVIVANPNGIMVEGAGFINTPKATLTTGKVGFNWLGSANYAVQEGVIEIKKDFDTTNIDKLELYSKAVKLNAKLNANDLEIITGSNYISNGRAKRRESDKKENFSISSSALGGLYGEKIRLVGTDLGVGINLPIDIVAMDDLSISADGEIILNKTFGRKDIKIRTSSDLNTNVMYAERIDIEAKKKLENNNMLNAQKRLSIKANELENKNLISSGFIMSKDGELIVNEENTQTTNIEANKLINEKIIFSKANLNIVELDNRSSSIVNKGQIKTLGGLEIRTDILDTTNTKINSEENSNIKVKRLKAKKSEIKVGRNLNIETKEDIDISSSKIFANKDIDIKTDKNIIANNLINYSENGDISLEAEGIEAKEFDLKAKDIMIEANLFLKAKNSNIQASQDLNIKAREDIDISSSKILVNEDIDITTDKELIANNLTISSAKESIALEVQDLEAKEAQIVAKKDIDIKSSKGANLNKSNLVALGDLTIRAKDKIIISEEDTPIKTKVEIIDNKEQVVRDYEASLIANGNVNLEAKSLDNKNSLISSENAIRLKIDKSIDNTNGVIAARNNININRRARNVDTIYKGDNSIILTSEDFSANLFNVEATNLNLKADDININTNFLQVENSNIETNNNLDINARNDIKLDSSEIVANENIDIRARGKIENQSLIKARNNLNLQADKIINSKGVIVSNNRLNLKTDKNIVNKNASLIRGGDVSLCSKNGNIINETSAETINKKEGENISIYDLVGDETKIEATNNLHLAAKKDIQNLGASLKTKEGSIILSAQQGDVKLQAKTLNNLFSSKNSNQAKMRYKRGNIKSGNNITINSGNKILIEASDLNAKEDLELRARNNTIDIKALNTLDYTRKTEEIKNLFNEKNLIDINHEEKVQSSNLNAKNIILTARKDINLEAVNMEAKEDIRVRTRGNFNIKSKESKELEIEGKNNLFFAGLNKNKKRKDKYKIDINASEISANNLVINAKELNVLASNIKTNEMAIRTSSLNLISAKEKEFQNEMSWNGTLIGVERNKGKLDEKGMESKIEIRDRIRLNRNNITPKIKTTVIDALEDEKQIKVMSSENDLKIRGLNQIKAEINSNTWDTIKITLED